VEEGVLMEYMDGSWSPGSRSEKGDGIIVREGELGTRPLVYWAIGKCLQEHHPVATFALRALLL